MNAILQTIYTALLGLGAKAPIVLAFMLQLIPMLEKLATDMGFGAVAAPHFEPSAAVLDIRAKLLAEHPDKLGDGTILAGLEKGILGLLSNPTFGPILASLLGKLLGGITIPTPTGG